MPWIAKYIGEKSPINQLRTDYYYKVGRHPSKVDFVMIKIHYTSDTIVKNKEFCRRYFNKPVWISEDDIKNIIENLLTTQPEKLSEYTNNKLVERFG